MIIIGILVAIFAGIGIWIENFFYDLALNPHGKLSIPESEDGGEKLPFETDFSWIESSQPKNIYIKSRDGLKLHAYAVEHPGTRRWLILCHGYMSCAKSMSCLGEAFYDMGFNVLLPDARGHGESEGKYYGMGWHDRKDVLRWVAYLNKIYHHPPMALYGISMGGATVMMASGEKLPKNVEIIIEDCGYTSIDEEFTFNLKNIFKLPKFPFLYLASMVTKMRAGYSLLTDGSALKQVAKSVTPTLFIHGSDDHFVPTYMVNKIYDAAKCPKEKLVIQGAEHGLSSWVAPDIYKKKVKEFVERYMTPEEKAGKTP